MPMLLCKTRRHGEASHHPQTEAPTTTGYAVDARTINTSRAPDRFHNHCILGMDINFNAVQVLLGIAVLAAFQTVAEYDPVLSSVPCFDNSDWAGGLFGIPVMLLLTSLTFSCYGVFQKYVKDKEEKGDPTSPPLWAIGLLIILHILHAVNVGVVYDHIKDPTTGPNTSATEAALCDSMAGHEAQALYLVFITTMVSLLHVLWTYTYALNDGLHKAYKVLVYGMIVGLFFYHALSDSGDPSDPFDSGPKARFAVMITIIAVFPLLAAYSGYTNQMTTFIGTQQCTIVDGYRLIKYGLAAVVVGANAITAYWIIHHDIQADDQTHTCIADSHDILSLGISPVGYWSLYQMSMVIACAQYVYQALYTSIERNETCFKVWKLNFGSYADTIRGFNTPNAIVVVTWIWLLVGYVMHGDDLDKCTRSSGAELAIFILHSIGLFCVVLVFQYGKMNGAPTITSSSALRTGPTAVVARPTTRLTALPSQVAVNITDKTPLNFA